MYFEWVLWTSLVDNFEQGEFYVILELPHGCFLSWINLSKFASLRKLEHFLNRKQPTHLTILNSTRLVIQFELI
jgi:hypothetical protein